MPEPRPDVLDFLLTRRSRPAKTLGGQAPTRSEIETLLTAAARTPDHGKLVPWRFIVLSAAEERARLATAGRAALEGQDLPADKIDKAINAFGQGGVIIVVVASPKASEKIPGWEQDLSAGAACLALLNAALAAGWGANWLTGPLARNDAFLTGAMGCQPGEYIAGFLHIGDEQVVPADRDRPDLEAITEWR